jgi:hypothetical protein
MELLIPAKELLLRSWDFFSKFLFAIVIFVIGWIVAKLIKALVIRVLAVLRIDSIAEQIKIPEFLSKGGIKYSLSELIGIVIYWIILLGVLVSSLDILALTGVANLLDKILGYIPNVIGALIILVLGIFLSGFTGSIVNTAAANIGLSHAGTLSKVAKVAIILFAILIALEQLKIGAVLISAMSIVLAAIGLGLALAFGLGCKEIAGRFVSDLIEKLKRK